MLQDPSNTFKICPQGGQALLHSLFMFQKPREILKKSLHHHIVVQIKLTSDFSYIGHNVESLLTRSIPV